MPRVLVLGSSGMLGYMVLKVLSQEKMFEVQGTQSEDASAPCYFSVEQGLKEGFNDYDYLINCIGILGKAINDNDAISVNRAIRINTLFPQELSQAVKGKVIHMSTDGVFSGRAEYYDEDAPHDCFDIYGKTKSLGEVAADNVLNIRTSIIGPSPFRKQGLWEWFMSQPDGANIDGYINHIWNGVTTLQYAELCLKIIKQNIFDQLRRESSVFHFAPNQPVSKYELLDLFKKVFNKNITINPIKDPRGDVRRVLVSKYDSFKNLFRQNTLMEESLLQLKDYIL